MSKKRIDWSIVRDWIENNWTFQEGCVVYNPDHIDEMATGMSAEVDELMKR